MRSGVAAFGVGVLAVVGCISSFGLSGIGSREQLAEATGGMKKPMAEMAASIHLAEATGGMKKPMTKLHSSTQLAEATGGMKKPMAEVPASSQLAEATGGMKKPMVELDLVSTGTTMVA